jgi:hypothetical protein
MKQAFSVGSAMNIREIIEIRDKLKTDLAVVEKFLEIAKRQGLANGETAGAIKENRSDVNQSTLAPIIAQSTDYGAIGESVLEAIKLCPSEFTVKDVADVLEKELKRTLNRTQIATVLARLSKRKKIHVVSQRQGQKPAIYRRL